MDTPIVSLLKLAGAAPVEAVPTATRPPPADATLPRAPRTPQETGLPLTLLHELLLKAMHHRGLQHLQALAQHLALEAALVETLLAQLRADVLVDVRHRGAHDGDVAYDLTTAGRARAAEALDRNRYAGPAPVPLEAYCARVAAQRDASVRVTKPWLDHVLADIAMSAQVRDQLGAAMNSQRATLLYGPPGAGKTYLCGQMARFLAGDIVVPHAIEVAGEIVQLFDPLVHRPARAARPATASLDNRERTDARWVLCERPVLVTGGELTLEMLDLLFDARNGYYQAPPHVKANNGLFLVDDLGRHLVTPRQLLNRWLMPMEHGHDFLMLRNGHKFRVPFDAQLMFSTNLPPTEIADEAFLRRVSYKIRIGEVDEPGYRRLVRDVCRGYGVTCTEPGIDHLVAHLHPRHARQRLACYPRDLVSQIADRAAYLGQTAELDAQTVEWAWNNYFAADDERAPATAPHLLRETTS